MLASEFLTKVKRSRFKAPSRSESVERLTSFCSNPMIANEQPAFAGPEQTHSEQMRINPFPRPEPRALAADSLNEAGERAAGQRLRQLPRCQPVPLDTRT